MILQSNLLEIARCKSKTTQTVTKPTRREFHDDLEGTEYNELMARFWVRAMKHAIGDELTQYHIKKGI